MTTVPYAAKRTARSLFIPLRGLRCHVLMWGDASRVSAQSPPLLMLHGWMDVAASFQFLIDALAQERCVIAPDWRGFGLSDAAPADGYWFPDYLADLDALVDAPGLGLKPGAEVDLLGHSMGGNVAMMYAGIRPLRVRRLINLEGFGLPEQAPALAPARYAQWLDELQQTPSLRDYDSLDAVAERLCRTNSLLGADKAAWLASHWSRRAADGRWHLLADARHKRINPVLYRAEEVLACWRRIRAPLLWVEGDRTEVLARWGARYPRSELDARLACVPQVERVMLSPAGHMLHHDQPEALARCIDSFLAR